MEWLKNLLKSIFPEKAEDIDKNFPKDIPQPKPEPEPKPEPKPKPEPEPKPDSNNPLSGQIDQLTRTITDLQKKIEGYETRIKQLTDAQQQSQKEKIEQVIQKAISEHRLPGKNEELLNYYRKILENDFEAGVKIVENLPPIPGEDKNQQNQNKKTTRILSPLESANPTIAKKVKEFANITEE